MEPRRDRSGGPLQSQLHREAPAAGAGRALPGHAMAKVDGKKVDLARACDVLGGVGRQARSRQHGRGPLPRVDHPLRAGGSARQGSALRGGLRSRRPDRHAARSGPGRLALENLARAVSVLERAGLPSIPRCARCSTAARAARRFPSTAATAPTRASRTWCATPRTPPRSSRRPSSPRLVEGSRWLTGTVIRSHRHQLPDGARVHGGGPRAQAFLAYGESGDGIRRTSSIRPSSTRRRRGGRSCSAKTRSQRIRARRQSTVSAPRERH